MINKLTDWLSSLPFVWARILSMQLRGIDPHEVVDARVRAVSAKIDIPIEALERHYLAGGHVTAVVDMLIKTKYRNLNVDFDTIAQKDLEGVDLPQVDPDEFENNGSQRVERYVCPGGAHEPHA